MGVFSDDPDADFLLSFLFWLENEKEVRMGIWEEVVRGGEDHISHRFRELNYPIPTDGMRAHELVTEYLSRGK